MQRGHSFIVVALTLSITLIASRDGYGHHPKGVEYKVFQFSEEKLPKIDGDPSDWSDVPADYKIDGSHLRDTVMGKGADMDPDDLAVEVIVGWSPVSNRLYFLYKVYDDMFNFNLPRGDIFEVVVDADHSGGRYHTFDDVDGETEALLKSTTAQNYHIFTPPASGKKWAWVWGSQQWLIEKPWAEAEYAYDFAYKESGTLYLEFYITPFNYASFRGAEYSAVHKLEENKIIGLSWSVLDYDESDTTYEGFWNLSHHTRMDRTASLLPNFRLMPLAKPKVGAEWPEFRGPKHDGHSTATDLPLHWSEEQNVAWKTAVHGRGWSTPVVVEDQLWLTTATPDGREMSVLCVDREDGQVSLDKILFTVENPRPLGNTVNTYASPSPLVDGRRVYVTFGSYGTACLDRSTGDVLWQRRDLKCNHFRGPASSPVLHEGRLIMHMDGSDYQYVVALDKLSGDEVWKVDRSTDFGDLDENGKPRANGDYRKAFNTPFISQLAGRQQMLSPGAKAAFAYDPADGSELWTVRYSTHSTASRSLVAGGLALINTGYSKPELWAVDASGRGDVTGTHVRWRRQRNIPKRSSPVLVDGLLYLVTDKGVASCVEAATGEEVWLERIGGNFSASLMHADGRIYFCSEEGETVVIKPARHYVELARNRLAAGLMASPVAAGDSLFLRTRTHLYRIRADV